MNKLWLLLMFDKELNDKNLELVKTFSIKPSAEDLLEAMGEHSAIDLSNNKEQLPIIEEGLGTELNINYILFNGVYTLRRLDIII